MNPAIQVENLSKQYHIGAAGSGEYRTLRESFTAAATTGWTRARSLTVRKSPTKEVGTFWALKDVSFDVQPGEVVGIVGRNGAGKSTLLKILSRITEPSQGRAVIRGRVGSLLEVGTGFHPELTGRENIYMNGSVLGMAKRDIERKFDAIVDFSDVSRFLDVPVKRYSSGMQVRLAFSVAAHLDPQILVIDEVLAVGDAEFQSKCLGKMEDVSRHGRTVIFVSHQLAAVQRLCTRGVLLDTGRVTLAAGIDDVVASYVSSLARAATRPLPDRNDRRGDGALRFTSIAFLDGDDEPVNSVTSGEPVSILVGYSLHSTVNTKHLLFALSIKDRSGILVALFSTDELRPRLRPLVAHGYFRIDIPALLLRGGDYSINLWASRSDSNPANLHDSVERADTITVLPGDYWKVGSTNRSGSYSLIDARITTV